MELSFPPRPLFYDEVSTVIEFLFLFNLALGVAGLVLGIAAFFLRKRGVPHGLGRFAAFAGVAQCAVALLGLVALVTVGVKTTDWSSPDARRFFAWVAASILGPSLVGWLSWSVLKAVARKPVFPSLSENSD